MIAHSTGTKTLATVISPVLLVAALAAVLILVLVLILCMRHKLGHTSSDVSTGDIPMEAVVVSITPPPTPKINMATTENTYATPPPSPLLPTKKVVLIYSRNTVHEEEQAVLGMLLKCEGVDLQYLDGRERNIYEWVEGKVKEAHTVLCVCNQQFSGEWETGDLANSPVACLRRLLPTCLEKVAVVLLRQSHKEYIPSDYLRSQQRFFVTNKVGGLQYYITGVPKYALSVSSQASSGSDSSV